ncbi:MAG: hypothetical protein QOF25_507 [Mycobacterium sp.]|nr:hypothetical protein [Mycobacterium sp.]
MEGAGAQDTSSALHCPVDVHFDVEQRLPESAEMARIEISSPAGNRTSLQATISFDPAVDQVSPPA